MEDCLQNTLLICSLEMINFTLGSILPSEIFISRWHHSDCRQIYLTKLNFAVLISACIEGFCRNQLSKLCFCVYCWDTVQDVILWIKKHFLYEDSREKFFSDQQDKNLKQLVCLYLMDNMDLLTENIFLLTLICRKCTAHVWPISCADKTI